MTRRHLVAGGLSLALLAIASPALAQHGGHGTRIGRVTAEVAAVRIQNAGCTDLSPLTDDGTYWRGSANCGGRTQPVAVDTRNGAVELGG